MRQQQVLLHWMGTSDLLSLVLCLDLDQVDHYHSDDRVLPTVFVLDYTHLSQEDILILFVMTSWALASALAMEL